MTSYSFAAFRFNMSKVMITTFFKLCERNPFTVIAQCQYCWSASQEHSSTAFLVGPSSVLTKHKCHGDSSLVVMVSSRTGNTIDKKTSISQLLSPLWFFFTKYGGSWTPLLLPCLNKMLKFRASLGNEPALHCTDLEENGLRSIATQ